MEVYGYTPVKVYVVYAFECIRDIRMMEAYAGGDLREGILGIRLCRYTGWYTWYTRIEVFCIRGGIRGGILLWRCM